LVGAPPARDPAALPFDEPSGRARAATALGVEEQPYRGVSVKLTIEVAAGQSDVTGPVREQQSQA